MSSAGWLSGAVAKQTEAEDIRVGITIDQIFAKQHRPGNAVSVARVRDRGLRRLHRRLRAGLQLHVHEHDLVGVGDRAAADGDQSARRVRAAVRPRGHAGAAAAAARREDRASSIPIVDEAACAAARAVGAADRNRLDDYLENVREIERRIQRTEARGSTDADSITAPIGIPESFEEHMRMMFDLLVVAYQADLTRVFTFMTGREASQRTYPGLAMKETHHDTSHHGGQAEKKAQHAKINALFISLFAEFIDKLDASPEGDGSLLDHSLIAYGHGMSDGQAHDSYPLPFAHGRQRRRPHPRQSLPDRAGVVADRESLARRRGHVRQPDRAGSARATHGSS